MRTALLLLALLGHVFLWVGLINRLHAVAISRKIIKTITMLGFVCMAALPVAWGASFAGQAASERNAWDAALGSPALRWYLAACRIVAVATIGRLAWRRLRRPPSVVRFHRSRRMHPASRTRPRVPCNEIVKLELTEWMLDVPRLDAALDGLSIVHVSDLHFTGWIDKSYFRAVVRLANELEPDFVAITGDLADHAECLEWAAEILGPLVARHGVYFILGNHDLHIDAGRLRGSLVDAGLIDLGGRSASVDVRGRPVILMGNESPWIRHDANLHATRACYDSCVNVCGPGVQGDSPIFVDTKIGTVPPDPAPIADSSALRIALSHTPDQFGWARTHDVDLLLAGHTHGGQICIPPLGAVFSPTFAGVKYVSGVFYREPTILHVTRGVSGDIPIRWNCPPELALLRLCAKPNRCQSQVPS